jgi:hypothetical protein
MSNLKIEKLGGLAGVGLPGSKMKSSGEQSMSALSADDQAAVEAMFRDPKARQHSPQMRDGFRYRITRTVNGKAQSVEVPESAVPAALQACVTDRLL